MAVYLMSMLIHHVGCYMSIRPSLVKKIGAIKGMLLVVLKCFLFIDLVIEMNWFLRFLGQNTYQHYHHRLLENSDPKRIRERDLQKSLFSVCPSANFANFIFFIKLNYGTPHVTIYGTQVGRKWNARYLQVKGACALRFYA